MADNLSMVEQTTTGPPEEWLAKWEDELDRNNRRGSAAWHRLVASGYEDDLLLTHLWICTRPGTPDSIERSHKANTRELGRFRKLAADLRRTAGIVSQALAFFRTERVELVSMPERLETLARWLDLNCDLGKNPQTRRYLPLLPLLWKVEGFSARPPWADLCVLLGAAWAAHGVPAEERPKVTPNGIRMFLRRDRERARAKVKLIQRDFSAIPARKQPAASERKPRQRI